MSSENLKAVRVVNESTNFHCLLVCEHASNYIPDMFDNLGLSYPLLQSHIAWDPGAFEVAKRLSDMLGAPIVKGEISRLVYDCNRPPTAVDAIPQKSEIFDIAGNTNLSTEDKKIRLEHVYLPFRRCLADMVAKSDALSVLITVHSFTPVYKGKERDVEIGILHDRDSVLADEILHLAPKHTEMIVRRNDPYGKEHGVTHTLQEHALPHKLLNVMLEIRNDLIANQEQCDRLSVMLCGLLKEAIHNCKQPLSSEEHLS